MFYYQKQPTVDCLIVTLQFAVAEAQLMVLITFTVAGTVSMVTIKSTIAVIQLIVVIMWGAQWRSG